LSDPYSPESRAAFLNGLTEGRRQQLWQRSAVPARTGSLPADLTAADEAFNRVHDEWDEADHEAKVLRSRAGAFPSAEDIRAADEAQSRADELWRLREAAQRNRDGLEARERDAMASLDRRPGWSREQW
jgi:hypothetical protein